jgi:hypothetical protein
LGHRTGHQVAAAAPSRPSARQSSSRHRLLLYCTTMYGQGFDAGPLGNALHPVTSTESQPPPEVAVGDKRKAPSSELDHRERHERFELPPAAAVPEWIAALVARDGLEAVVNAVLKSAPRDRVMAVMEELCNQQLGVEPIVLHEDGQVSSCRLVMGSQPQLTRASLGRRRASGRLLHRRAQTRCSAARRVAPTAALLPRWLWPLTLFAATIASPTWVRRMRSVSHLAHWKACVTSLRTCTVTFKSRRCVTACAIYVPAQ